MLPSPKGHSCSLALCAGLLITVSVCPSHAQTSNSAIAEALFQDGRRLMDEGKTAEGCAKLEQSQRSDPKIGTLLNVAVCHEQLGRTATAWAEFLDAEAQANREGQVERAAFAREGVERLQSKLSRLILNAGGNPSGVTLALDGAPFAASMLGTSLPVDPGEHRLEVSAPGKQTATLSLTIAPGPSEQILTLPALEDEVPPPVPVVATPPPTPPGPPPEAPPARPAASEGVPGWAWVSLGVGAAGILTGSVTGAMALSKAAQLQSACPNKVCPEGQSSQLDTALTLADISTVSFIIGAVGSAVGLTGVLTSRGTEIQSGLFLQFELSRVGVVSYF